MRVCGAVSHDILPKCTRELAIMADGLLRFKRRLSRLLAVRSGRANSAFTDEQT